MKNTFGTFITEIGVDPRVVLLTGDVGGELFGEFRTQYPDRFFNVGIREEAMVGMAAGMALNGSLPYVYTVSSFLLERAYEFIKVDIDMMNLDVKLVGLNTSRYGDTHVCLNSRGMTTSFSNIQGYFPKNKKELTNILYKTQISSSPCYIELK